MMKKPRMVKQGWIIAAIVILVIVVVLGAIYLLQQDNIKAAANAKRYTQQQLQEQLAESRQEVEAVLSEQAPGLQVRDLTDEERSALRQGELSAEELVDILTGGSSSSEQPQSGAETAEPNAPPSTAAPEQTSPPPTAAPTSVPSGTLPTATAAPTPPPTPEPSPGSTPVPTPEPSPDPDEEYKTELAKIIAEVYILREEFTVKLEDLAATAKAEYRAMPEGERTKSKLVSWAAGYAEKASAMEKDCDIRMYAIIDKLNALVEKYQADSSIVKTLINSYASEKSIQKSLYIQELEKRGIM